MVYCKKFIAGINAINFSPESAKLIKGSLVSFALNELEQTMETLKGELRDLPKKINDNPIVNEQLKKYRQKQEENLRQIDGQIDALKRQASEEDLRVEAVELDETFLREFAENFRNLRHLADTLSDAPTLIKEQQTRLYTEILFKLDPAEQENQLQSLSLSNIQDMIKQAIVIYDTQKDIQLRNQAQKLVQMGMYEIVRRECLSVSEAPSADYVGYQEMLRSLGSKLPSVGNSSVIDDLSQYRSAADKKSIADLLLDVENKLKINVDADWRNQSRIDAFIERKALFHHLRFGQEDRREYAKKTQNNIARDLFWGRNIRDIELFTKGGVSDDVFAGLCQKLFLGKPSTFSDIVDAKLDSFDPEVKRLGIVMAEAKVKFKDSKNKKPLKQLVKEIFEEKFLKPSVSINKDGTIVVNFYYFADEESIISRIGETALRWEPSSLLGIWVKQSQGKIKDLHGLQLTGKSLADIEKQLTRLKISEDLPKEAREAYISQLNNIKDTFGSDAEVQSISDLKLDNNDEILLRKLLELRYIAPVTRVTDNLTIREALRKLSTGDFEGALKVTDLEKAVNDAYINLAKVDQSTVKPHVRPIIQKSRTLTSSFLERKAKLLALDHAFQAQSSEEKIAAITEIFLEEYFGMASTLGFSEREIRPRLESDIRGMATEVVRLLDRTQKGDPALTKEEQAAYFSALKQIAEQIHPLKISEVQFKIPYSHEPGQEILVTDNKGNTYKVALKEGSFPYSLIKPPGESEVVFSYGGSRGVIAPFEGFDEAYLRGSAKKRRFFTHSRLLGVGQYGSVREVESLLSGLNQVIKKGYVPDTEPTFTEASRSDLRTRPITARDDPLYRIESDILQNLSRATKANEGTLTGSTQYWIQDDKPRRKGALFAKDSTPKQYQILTERAKGETFADAANNTLNQYTKGEEAYHNPAKRLKKEGEGKKEFDITPLKNMVALSEAITTGAEKFAQLGFAHNDLKPENFLFKQNPDGSYQVRFIDWATGGFEAVLPDSDKALSIIFGELFGKDLKFEEKGNICFDNNGRFVKKEKGQIIYGVNPSLQILHGARNGTLPYISPKVLEKGSSVAAGITDPSLDTKLESKQDYMDNWALTAMTFGICNRRAYFALVKGRAVSDYIVPGILVDDGKTPLGLKIVNAQLFNDYFACRDRLTESSLQTDEPYTKPNAVMFIPGNQREGEPLHLYRRLEALKQELSEKLPEDKSSLEYQIIRDIDTILDTVYEAVSSGKGLTKKQLREQLDAASRCIKNYEKLRDKDYQEALAKRDSLQTILNQHLIGGIKFTANDLLKRSSAGGSDLEVLCTYPANKEQKEQAIAILDQAFDEGELEDKFIREKSPGRRLFMACIANKQSEILIKLLGKISAKNDEFVNLVEKQGLLHYAAQEGMSDVFDVLVSALQKAGASNTKIFKLMISTYGPENKEREEAANIKWATTCFHIAIRNNNKQQLNTILHFLPEGSDNDEVIKQALHLCAVFGNKELFNSIVKRYDELNPRNKLTAEKIMTMVFPPDDLSPYHLFIRDEATVDVIAWKELKENKELAKQFLGFPGVSPALIAAERGNFKAIDLLVKLGKDALAEEEWYQFFTQTDGKGKNILNHILEQGQLDYLHDFIEMVKEQGPDKGADILVSLLGNPRPLNPLNNFLRKETNITQQFAVAKELLDAICPKFSSNNPKPQQARLVALLLNKDWLIAQAAIPTNHEALRLLLQNEALSIPYKKVLFERLHEASKISEEATEFYKDLLAEVAPAAPAKKEMDSKTRLEIAGVLKEVARQSSDLNAFFKELISQHEAEKELGEQVSSLRDEVSRYRKEAEEVTLKLSEQQDIVRKVTSELQGTSKKLEVAENDSQRLKEEIEKINSSYEIKLKELQSKADENVEKVERLEEEYRLGKQELQKKLLEKEEEALGLSKELDKQKALLSEGTKVARELGEELKQLRLKNDDLSQKLKEETTLRKEERARLEEGLREESAKTSDAVKHVEQLSLQLKNVSEEHDELKKKATILESTNAELLEKVSSLEDEVSRYRKEAEEVTLKLSEQQDIVRKVTSELQGTSKKLEVAENDSQRLKEEIEKINSSYEIKLKELQSKADENVEKVERLEEEYRLGKQELQKKLLEKEEEALGLSKELDKQKALLSEGTKVARELGEELKQLRLKNDDLSQKLKEETTLRKEERARLEEGLREESAKTSDAVKHVEQLSLQLKNVSEEHDELKKKATILESTNAELLEKVSSLEDEVSRYRKEAEEVTLKLSEQQDIVRKVTSELQGTSKKLEVAENDSQRLKEEIEKINSSYEIKLKELQSKADENVEKVERLEEEYRLGKQELQKKLLEKEEEALGLSKELDKQKALLSEGTKVARELGEELKQLRLKNDDLSQKLKEETTLRKEERARLEEGLREESAKTSDAVKHVEQLSLQLKNVSEEHDELKKKATILESTNAELLEKVSSLEDEVSRYRKEAEEVTLKLSEQQDIVRKVTSELQGTSKKLEVAENDSQRLKEEIEKINSSYEIKLKELQSKADENVEKVERLEEEYRLGKQELQKKLLEKEEEALGLSKELDKQKALLSEGTKVARELGEELKQLRLKNDDLSQKLKEETTLRKEERARLEEGLREESAKTSDAVKHVEQLSLQLKNVSEEHDELKKKATILESTNAELLEKVSSLEDEVSRYRKEAEEVTLKLSEQQDIVRKVTSELQGTSKKLEVAENDSQRLKEEIEKINSSYEIKLKELQSKADENVEKVERLEEEYRLGKQELQKKLLEKEEEALGLSKELDKQKALLSEGTKVARELGEELKQLRLKNDDLSQKLKEETTLRKEERARLEEGLREESAKTSDAVKHVEQLSLQLKNVSEEHDELKKKATILESTNAELLEKVSSLEDEVSRYRKEAEEVTLKLSEQQDIVRKVTSELQGTSKKLEVAENDSQRLKEEIEKINSSYEIKLKELQSKADENVEKVERLEEEYRLGKQELQKKLLEKEEEALGLSKELDKQKALLSEGTKVARELGEELKQLRLKNDDLSQKLKEETTLRKEERARLEEGLREESAKTSDAVKHVEQLSLQLKNVSEEHDELKKKATILESTNAELLEKVSSLEDEVSRYRKEAEEVTLKLSEQQDIVRKVTSELQGTSKKLEVAENDSQRLKEEIEKINSSYEIKLKELQSKADENVEKVERLEEEYRLGKQELQKKLLEKEEEALGLSKELDKQKALLSEGTKVARELGEELKQLRLKNDDLSQKLKEETTLRKEERARLEEGLREESAKTSDAVKHVEQLSLQLKNVSEEHDELKKKATILESTNAELLEKVSSLEDEVSRYRKEAEEVTLKLSEQQDIVRKVTSELQGTSKKLEVAENDSQRLKEEIEKINSSYEIKLKELQSKADENVEKVERLEEEYRLGKQELQKKLLEKEDEALGLSKELDKQKALLSEGTKVARELGEELKQLRLKNDDLSQKLKEETTLRKEERARLEEGLREESAKTSDAVKHVEQLSLQLKNVSEEHDELKKKATILESTNAELLEQVSSLRDEVKQYKVKLEQTTRELEEQRQVAREASKKEKETGAELEDAKLLIERMRQEMEELRKQMELREVKHKEDLAHQKDELLQEKREALREQKEDLDRVREESLIRQKDDLLRQQKEALENQKEDLDRRHEEEQREALERQREELQRQHIEELRETREQVATLTEELDTARRELREVREELDETQQELERVQQRHTVEMEELGNERDELEEERDRLQEQLRIRAEQAELLEDPQLLAQRQALVMLNAQIKISKDIECLTGIRDARSNADLQQAGVDAKLVAALAANAFTSLGMAAQNRLAELGRIEGRKRIDLLNPNRYKTTLARDLNDLKSIYQNLNGITSLSEEIRDELRFLANVSPLHWLNPGFQAAAKKHSNEMAPHFQKLADGCDVILGYLKPLRNELEHQLRCIPADLSGVVDQAQVNAIERRRAVLTRYLRRVEGQIALYEPLHKRLYGDPGATNQLMKEGILHTIKNADKYDVQFLSFTSNYEDHPLAEREGHFQPGYVSTIAAPAAPPTGAAVHGATHATYQIVERVKPGEYREHLINVGDPLSGSFIEERATTFQPDPDQEDPLQGYRPDLQLTVTQFPVSATPNDPLLVPARVKWALAFATQLLADLEKAPTKKEPVLLYGQNEEVLRYLWTALVVIGKKTPNMTFDHTAVKVVSTAFNPQNELERVFGFTGWRYQFAPNSCYETCFKNQAALVNLLEGIREASENKLGHQQEQAQIKTSVAHVTRMFAPPAAPSKAKTAGETIVEKLRQETQRKGPRGEG